MYANNKRFYTLIVLSAVILAAVGIKSNTASANALPASGSVPACEKVGDPKKGKYTLLNMVDKGAARSEKYNHMVLEPNNVYEIGYNNMSASSKEESCLITKENIIYSVFNTSNNTRIGDVIQPIGNDKTLPVDGNGSTGKKFAITSGNVNAIKRLQEKANASNGKYEEIVYLANTPQNLNHVNGIDLLYTWSGYTDNTGKTKEPVHRKTLRHIRTGMDMKSVVLPSLLLVAGMGLVFMSRKSFSKKR